MKVSFFISIILLFPSLLLAQIQETIYYDKDWKGCSGSEASYYRLVTFDAAGKPLGKVMDYYVSGELQGEAEEALHIDRTDDSRSVFTGNMKGYRENGVLNWEKTFSATGQPLSQKVYYDDGAVHMEYSLNADSEVHGEYREYRPDGSPFRKAFYENGNLVRNVVQEFDLKGWPRWRIYNGNLHYSVLLPGDGWEADEAGQNQNFFYQEQGGLTAVSKSVFIAPYNIEGYTFDQAVRLILAESANLKAEQQIFFQVGSGNQIIRQHDPDTDTQYDRNEDRTVYFEQIQTLSDQEPPWKQYSLQAFLLRKNTFFVIQGIAYNGRLKNKAGEMNDASPLSIRQEVIGLVDSFEW